MKSRIVVSSPGLAVGLYLLTGIAVLLLAQRGLSVASLGLIALCQCVVYTVCRRLSDLITDWRHLQTEKPTLADIYRSTTEALASAIAAKESYTHHRPDRVQDICALVAAQLGVEPDLLEGMRLAALLRDIGKLGVPGYILLKPGPLDEEEFRQVSNHAAIGAALLERVRYPWDVAGMVRHHHERFDGTGYPDHLSGDAIPLGARVIAVADVYDALTSDRSYREGWSHHQSVAHIEGLAGTHFDPGVVEAFLAVEREIEALEHRQAPPELTAEPADCAAAESIAQANRELVALFEIAQSLSSTLEIDEVVSILAHRARRLVEATCCGVLLRHPEHANLLVVKTAVGRGGEAIKGARAVLGKGVSGRSAARRRPFAGPYDRSDLELADPNGVTPEFRSCAVAPIVSFGELIGMVNLYDCSPDAFNADDLRVLMFIAHQAGLAIQNASAFEQVRDSATRDSLTGLHNGRYLRHYLEREISRAARLGEPVSVLGIDLDCFKEVNDRLGHQAGDEALQAVADIFRAQLRDYDLAARNGGDEFVIVLPGTPGIEARRTAERIRREIDRYAARLGTDSTASGCAPIGFGASVGVACYPEDGGDTDTLLGRADAAMYRDKRARKQAKLAA